MLDMMKKTQVKKDLRQSTNNLLEVLSAVSADIFNTRPDKDEWSIGKVAEHLIKVETGTVRMFTGPAETSVRDPEEKIENIKVRMLDYETKMSAYGPIIPDDKPKDKTKALEKIQDIRQQMSSFIDIQDLTETVTGFEHPIFGLLTRIEWIYFNIFHSRRHTYQIEEINNSISRKRKNK